MNRFQWERYIVGDCGPASPTTRHVLLTIATHASRALEAHPSTRLLAAETGLSERAVVTHINSAVTAGWLSRDKRRGEGKQWRQSFYSLTVPAALLAAEPASAPNGRQALNHVQQQSGEHTECGSVATPRSIEGAEPDALATEPEAEGAERRDTMVMNDVQSNNALSSTKNIKSSIYPAKSLSDCLKSKTRPTYSIAPTEPTEQTRDVQWWAEHLGIAKHPGERPGEFQLRVIGEKQEHERVSSATAAG